MWRLDQAAEAGLFGVCVLQEHPVQEGEVGGGDEVRLDQGTIEFIITQPRHVAIKKCCCDPPTSRSSREANIPGANQPRFTSCRSGPVDHPLTTRQLTDPRGAWLGQLVGVHSQGCPQHLLTGHR